jgi:putative ABC transport system ATP-binding protein
MDWRADTLDDLVRELHTKTRSKYAESMLGASFHVKDVGEVPAVPGAVVDWVGMRQLFDFLSLLEVAASARMLPDPWPDETRRRVQALVSNEVVVEKARKQGLQLLSRLRARLTATRFIDDDDVPVAVFQWFLDLTIPFRRDRSVGSYVRIARRGQVARSLVDQRGLARFVRYVRELNELLEQTADCPVFHATAWHSHAHWASHHREIHASLVDSLGHYGVDDERVLSVVSSMFDASPALPGGDEPWSEGETAIDWRRLLSPVAVNFPGTVPVQLPSEAPSPTSVIALTNVSKVFYTDEVETQALSNINMTIERGEFVAVAGPSGSGKSTLLSILGLLESPSEGAYWLNGRRVSGLSLGERARVRNREIGFIFQSFNLIGDLTVFENVELPLIYRGMTAVERSRHVNQALEKVGLSHRSNHLPSQLSGGQQQRVAIARAVAGPPSILLADEPTGNLDSKNGEAAMELLRMLNKDEGMTICLVTHDQRFAAYAGREIHLFDGRIVEVRGKTVTSGGEPVY